MLNSEKGKFQHRSPTVDIFERSQEYALRSITLYKHLQKLKDGAAGVIGKQFLRSATSIGANLVEARAGESRRDFIHKFSIAQKEARESLYWLNLLNRSEIVSPDRLCELIDETNQLISIITTILVKTKRGTAT